jgi:YegS/Rv2252/BmrU family lipid kinase
MTDERTVVLISNPNAGRGGRHRALEVARFRELLGERGIVVEVLSTSGPGDATLLAQSAAERGVREVIVSGGDGTINEALQGLVGRDVRIGIWPRGTANVLAHELNLPSRVDKAVEVIARGLSHRIYIGRANIEATGEHRYFFLMAGVGLDASIVEAVRPRLKRRIGKGAFWYSGIGHLLRWQPVPFRIEVDEEMFEGTFAAIGKAPHYGGGLSITPRARLDKPEFEVCVINSRSRLRYLRLLSRAMRAGVRPGTHGIFFKRGTRVRATGDVLVQVDGEIIGRPPMTFEIVPHPIEVITP